MRKSLAILLVLVLATALVVAVAQDKPAKSKSEQEAMPMGMPPMPTAELAKLDVFLGTWSGDETINFPGMPPNTKTKSTIVTKKTLGGMYIMGSYKGGWEVDGKKTDFEGMSLTTYDAMKQTYREWWFDSMGWGSESQGKWVDDKTYVAESSGDMGGQPFKQRGTTNIVSPTKHTTKMEMDMGQGWVTTMEGTYTKQAEKKANK
ncbi:MAG: hypothetical protein RBG1_1C00001G1082 [candidate division Zixibacteria bacterium RBG-1]|nr:MAG: hypothetical protein RBG1_1C00001G1082 [candidate division Zixibacteria bacterium RBG-1]OGC83197.1 MAG: hypothetical protein A2V73_06770 [candidate division Zixibacteria bacterium RBG_19FT_COMBO_42_43]